jgi:hypothetical protein
MKKTEVEPARIRKLKAIVDATLKKEYAAYKIEDAEIQRLRTFTEGFYRGMDFILDGRKDGFKK